jgi:hypothetical protein
MGRQGIKRRKRKRELPDVRADDLSVTDEHRAFGHFRWNTYSPAGTLERHGFFWRQVGRTRSDPTGGWRRPVAWILTVAAVIAAGVIVANVVPWPW